jgi:small subunit ribosomal protein S21
MMKLREGQEHRPVEVQVDSDNLDRALRALKRKMANEGVYKELKKRKFFLKPSEQKKRKQREAERRRRKAMRSRLRKPDKH